MDEETHQALAAIDRVCEEGKRYGAFELTDDYLELLARLEDLPANRTGADKTSVEVDWLRFLAELRSAREQP